MMQRVASIEQAYIIINAISIFYFDHQNIILSNDQYKHKFPYWLRLLHITRYGVPFTSSHSFYGIYTKLALVPFGWDHVVPNFPHSTLHCIRQTELKMRSHFKIHIFIFIRFRNYISILRKRFQVPKEVAQRFHKCFHCYIFTRQSCFDERRICDTIFHIYCFQNDVIFWVLYQFSWGKKLSQIEFLQLVEIVSLLFQIHWEFINMRTVYCSAFWAVAITHIAF